MDLRVLEYFLMVADEGNITHASELTGYLLYGGAFAK